MYDLQMKPYSLASVKGNHICLAGRNGDKSEILCAKLPEKLQFSDEESGRCKSKDFEILDGNFFDNLIRDLGVLPGDEFAVASFKQTHGLNKFRIAVDGSGVSQDNFILTKSGIVEPEFAVNPEVPELLACRSTDDPILCVDCTTGDETSIILPYSLSNTNGLVYCSYLNSDTAVFLHSKNGAIGAIDLRTNKDIFLNSGDSFNEVHTHSTDGNTKIATLDESGHFLLYDTRQLGQSLVKTTLCMKININAQCSNRLSNETVKKRIRFGKSNKISISGFDNSVNIYTVLNQDCVHLFRHEGHSHMEDACEGIVTDHMWIPDIAENFILSCSDNGSLNCWQFVL